MELNEIVSEAVEAQLALQDLCDRVSSDDDVVIVSTITHVALAEVVSSVTDVQLALQDIFNQIGSDRNSTTVDTTRGPCEHHQLHGVSGNFSSLAMCPTAEHYSYDYPNNASWSIFYKHSDNSSVYFNVMLWLYIEPNIVCEHDFLNVHTTGGYSVLMCGYRYEEFSVQLNASESIHFDFTSDDYFTNWGFYIDYNVTNHAQYDWALEDIWPLTGQYIYVHACTAFNIYNTSGVINTLELCPRHFWFFEHYPNWANWTFVFTNDDTEDVYVNVKFNISIEPEDQCRYDELIIMYGDYEISVCGYRTGKFSALIPSGESLVFWFKSDWIITEAGFVLEYDVSASAKYTESPPDPFLGELYVDCACTDYLMQNVSGIIISDVMCPTHNWYLDNYPNFVAWKFTFTNQNDESIYLNLIIATSIEEHMWCLYDELSLTFGDTFFPMCGYRYVELSVLLDSGEKLEIKFKSDESVTDYGFEIGYYEHSEPEFSEELPVAYLGDAELYVCSFVDLTNSSGVVNSLLLCPTSWWFYTYPNYANWTFRYENTGNDAVYINIYYELSIEPEEECVYDSLDIFSDDCHIHMCGIRSGNFSVQLSAGASILFHFHSDWIITDLGFFIHYTITDSAAYSQECPLEYLGVVPDENACSSETVDGPYGVISSRELCNTHLMYQFYYAPDVDWTFTYQNAESHVVYFNVHYHIDIEGDLFCEKDRLMFQTDQYDYWLCGTRIGDYSFPVPANGDLKIKFHSNQYNEWDDWMWYEGFDLYYNCTDEPANDCSYMELLSFNGTISSADQCATSTYNSSLYPNNIDWEFILFNSYDGWDDVYANIHYDISIERHATCDWDALYFSNGYDVVPMCGERSGEFSMPLWWGSYLRIWFSSDYTIGDLGFTIQYSLSYSPVYTTSLPIPNTGVEVYEYACEGVWYWLDEGVINSRVLCNTHVDYEYNYPNYAGWSFHWCNYWGGDAYFFVEYDISIEGHIHCDYDKLRFITVDEDKWICGHRSGNFTIIVPAYSTLEIRFSSDYSVTYPGFVLSYDADYDYPGEICNYQELLGSYGYINSLDLCPCGSSPDVYPPYADWYFVLHNNVFFGVYVNLDFTIDIEEEAECLYDMLEISNGIDSVIMCGYRTGQFSMSLTTGDAKLEIRFRSDFIVEKSGFDIEWTTSYYPEYTTDLPSPYLGYFISDCNAVEMAAWNSTIDTTEMCHAVYYPEYADYHFFYNNNAACREWVNLDMDLSINDYLPDCSNAMLNISANGLVLTLCGVRAGEQLSVPVPNGTTLALDFTSNSYWWPEFEGFRISYTVSDGPEYSPCMMPFFGDEGEEFCFTVEEEEEEPLEPAHCVCNSSLTDDVAVAAAVAHVELNEVVTSVAEAKLALQDLIDQIGPDGGSDVVIIQVDEVCSAVEEVIAALNEQLQQ